MSSTEKFLKENDINPYKLLKLTKNSSKKQLDTAYKKKIADTTNIDIIELKFLNESYTYILNNIPHDNGFSDNNNDIVDEIFKQNNKNFNDDTYDDRNFYKTDFNNPIIRKKLFPNDTLDFDSYKKKDINQRPQSFNIKNLFENQKFNVKKFNEIFEENHNVLNLDDENGNNGVVKELESSSSLTPMAISTYKGIIIENNNTDPKNFKKVCRNDDILKLQEKINSKNKKVVKKNNTVENKNLQELERNMNIRKNESVKVNIESPFNNVNAIMHDKQVQNIKKEMMCNKDYILDNINIYPRNIIDQFISGNLEDSSSCVKENELQIPDGRRKL